MGDSKLTILGDKRKIQLDDGSTIGSDNRLPVEVDPKETTDTICLLEQILVELKKQNEYLEEILGG